MKIKLKKKKPSPHISLADKLFPVEKLDEDMAVIDIPPDKRRLLTETFDFSISTIIQQLKDRNIYIPDFQRKYVWNRSQASRLIESLIIQCPIPVIYLNQDSDERFSVIDGNQRLTSIDLFLKNDFALQGLSAYPELEGNYYKDLDPRFQRHIANRTLRCISILKETHPQIKFDVFERINTGAAKLNPQEIRHGVYHGKLIKLVDELAKEKIWRAISGHKNDVRMKGDELILRFIAFSKNFNNYKKPLSSFLNNFCETNRNISDEMILEIKTEFLDTVKKVNTVFSSKGFKMLNPDLLPVGNNVNAALFDAVMISFSKIDISTAQIKKLQKTVFLRKHQIFISSPEFKKWITSGTSANSSVKNRISKYQAFLSDYIS